MVIINILRRLVNKFGLDVIRYHKSPKRTCLGLTESNISTIIDVGANEGQFARKVSSFFPEAKLYCFEPLAEPFTQLYGWAQTQNERVECFQLALGDQDGIMEMYLHEQHTPSSSLLKATNLCHEQYPQTRNEHREKIKMSTLDIALDNHLDPSHGEILLKLDVQGFEDRVLLGGKRVLAKCKAVLLEASIDPLYEGQADFFSLTRILHEAGFHYAGNVNQTYGENGRVVYVDAIFLR